MPIGEGRYALDLPLDPPPERLLVDLAASGAKLISLNPIRPTLEDLFVEQVTSPAAMAPRRGRLMKATAAIAVNVFRESVRDKVLYNLVLFAILMMGASYLLGQLTAGQDVKIIKDLGLSAISVFGLFIAVFIGIGLVSKEVERRSVYSLLPKPIHRYQLILGKYAGLTLTLVVNISIMTLAFYAVLLYTRVGRRSDRSARMGCAGARSGAAQGDCSHSCRAAASSPPWLSSSRRSRRPCCRPP